MTQLNSQNVTHKESDNVDTVRKYFRIYTKDRVFNVYKDFFVKNDLDVPYMINNLRCVEFQTYDDKPIYINTKQIVAVETSTYMFPERT